MGSKVRVLGVILAFVAAVAGAEGPPEGTPVATSGEPGTDGAKAEELQKEPLPGFAEVVTVVASPLFEEVTLTPFATPVTVVSQGQLADGNAYDLASALRRLPGIVVSRYDLVGSYGGADGGAVFVRGLGSSRPGAELSVLFDGVPRFVGVWAHPLLDLARPQVAERIEVYRGPEPVLFGNMAFATVNIKPKTARSPGTAISGTLGRWGTHMWQVEHAATSGTLRFMVEGDRQESNGHRPHSAGQVDHLLTSVEARLGSGWAVRVVLDGVESWAEDPGPRDAPPRGAVPRFGVRDTFAVATVTHRRGAWEGEAKAYWQEGRIAWRQWDAGQRYAFRTLTDFSAYGVRVQERRPLGRQGQVVFGLDHGRYGGETEEIRPQRVFRFSRLLFTDTAAYAMVGGSFGETVTVHPSLGVRLQHSEDFGDHWGGQAGVVVARGANSLYARVSRAFNLPGVYTAVLFARWGRGQSWRKLDAELLDHREVGFRREGKVSTLLVSVFHEEGRDALRFQGFPPPPTFVNLGRYRIAGAEASLQWRVTPHWAATAGLAHLDPEPENVPNAPRWSGSVGVAGRVGERFRVSLDVQRATSRTVLNPRYAVAGPRVPGFTVVNAKVSLPVILGTSMWADFWVAGENLTNQEFAYLPGYPAPGRFGMAGFEVRF